MKACAARQTAILESAAKAVREGGMLVYSTCTFSSEEDEGVISGFLSRHGDFEPVDCGVAFGRPAALPFARRIYPMDGGEGHFVAAMHRNSENRPHVQPHRFTKGPEQLLAEKFCRSLFSGASFGRLEQIRDDFFLVPEEVPEYAGLGVLRAGVLLGKLRGKRLEPAHAVFMACNPSELRSVISLPHDSAEIYAFLHGEEIKSRGAPGGYAAVAVDGVVTGFGKVSNGTLKNHYPKGLRNMNSNTA